MFFFNIPLRIRLLHLQACLKTRCIRARLKALMVAIPAVMSHTAILAAPPPAGIYPADDSAYLGCPVYFTPIPLTLDITSRVAGLTLYQASQTITFEPGFMTETGASFTAELTLVSSQVPPATHQTGTADLNINWIQASSYDETGALIGDTRQFYDYGGQPIQTQRKVFYRKDAATVYTHVLASQTIRDAKARDAATTMAAPIDYADFSYQGNFLQHNAAGSNYSHQNFDLYNATGAPGGDVDNTIRPDPLWDASSGPPVQGTLGWYYSTSNNWEPYTPTSDYPYTRLSFYADGTGNVKKSAGIGNQFRTGSNHEASSYTTPVLNELEDYNRVRNHFFAVADLGNLPANLQYQAMQVVSRDPNGNEVVAIQDKSGRVLMTARPGTDLVPTANTVTLSAMPYSLTVPAVPTGAGCSFNSQFVKFYGNGKTFTLTNPANQVLTLTGPQSGDSVSFTPTDWGTVVRSDEPFSVVYQDKQTTACSLVPTSVSSQAGVNGAPREYYFKILADNTSVTITGDYTLFDMSSETATSLLTGNQLKKGYYKVVVNTGSITLTYGNGYTDVSYNFFNQNGQLIATIPPEGVKKLYGSGINSYANRSLVPFITLYTYDLQDRLVSTQDPDGGIHSTVYRKDGKFRFSQNALQAAAGSFSYTNYDQNNRPVETGQYLPGTGGILYGSAAMTGILENTGPGGGLINGTKTDVSLTTYDIPDISHGLAGYSQDAFNLAGAVSMTQRYSSIVNNSPVGANLVSAAWYNYDEEGKVIWTIKYINGLGYKTTDYSYDALGHLTKKVFQASPAASAETFVHYYDYDPANKQLWHVYTNTTDDLNSRQLQATYTYYLHGGVKRVELAGNLQGIDYTYTLQGALKAINNSNKSQDPGNDGSNGFAADAFGMALDYFDGDYANSRDGVATIGGVDASSITTGSYAGNIRAMTWYTEKPATTLLPDAPNTYVYQYDPKYQFTESTWGTGINFGSSPAGFTATTNNKESVKDPVTHSPAYDGNGNIQYLQRLDGSGAAKDLLKYNYAANNNQLTSVVNTGPSPAQTYTYTYDANGQMTGELTGDANQKYMVYDPAGNVTGVYKDAGHTMQVAGFVYDELGRRIEKLMYNNSGLLAQVTYYADDVVYTKTVTNGGTTFGPAIAQEYQISEGAGRLGVFYRPANIYAYELDDHLGNVRAVIAKNNTSYEVRMYTDYYPFGMVISSGVTNDYRYGYQGQHAETDAETSWNSFELRMYDSRIARWLQVDPKGEFSSPYLGMGNNPVSKVDPDGGCTGCPEHAQQGDVYKENGNIYVASKVGNDYVWSTYMPAATVSFNERAYFFDIFMDRFQGNQQLVKESDSRFYKDHVDSWNKYYSSMRASWEFQGEVYKFFLTSMIPVGEFAGIAAKFGGTRLVTWAGKKVLQVAVDNPLWTAAADLARQRAGTIGSAMFGRGVDNTFRAIVDTKAGLAGKILNFAESKGYIFINPTNKGADIVGLKLLSGSWWDMTTAGSWGAHVAKYGDGGIGLIYVRP